MDKCNSLTIKGVEFFTDGSLLSWVGRGENNGYTFYSAFNTPVDKNQSTSGLITNLCEYTGAQFEAFIKTEKKKDNYLSLSDVDALYQFVNKHMPWAEKNVVENKWCEPIYIMDAIYTYGDEELKSISEMNNDPFSEVDKKKKKDFDELSHKLHVIIHACSPGATTLFPESLFGDDFYNMTEGAVRHELMTAKHIPEMLKMLFGFSSQRLMKHIGQWDVSNVLSFVHLHSFVHFTQHEIETIVEQCSHLTFANYQPEFIDSSLKELSHAKWCRFLTEIKENNLHILTDTLSLIKDHRDNGWDHLKLSGSIYDVHDLLVRSVVDHYWSGSEMESTSLGLGDKLCSFGQWNVYSIDTVEKLSHAALALYVCAGGYIYIESLKKGHSRFIIIEQGVVDDNNELDVIKNQYVMKEKTHDKLFLAQLKKVDNKWSLHECRTFNNFDSHDEINKIVNKVAQDMNKENE